MQRKLVLALIPVLLLTLLHTQGLCRRRDALGEMLLGHRPGARGEGLGRGGVALTGDVASSSYNPAGLAEAGGLSFLISGTNYCGYGYCSGDYLYIAGSLPVRDYGVVGLSRYRYGSGYETALWAQGGDAALSLDEIWLYTLTFATEPARDLYVGASLNLMRSRYDRIYDNVFYGDLGITRVFARRLSRSTAHRLTVGSSISNFNSGRRQVGQSEEDIPVILRVGGSYSLAWEHASSPKGLETLRFMVHAEYQDLVNSGLHNAGSLGAEILVLEILALRLGRYWEEIDDSDEPDVYAGTAAETTFGWGITIPANSLTRGKLPFNLSLDRVQLDPPGAAQAMHPGTEYRILTLSLSWSL